MRIAVGLRLRARRFAALLGVLALLLQSAVPLAHEPLGSGALAAGPLCHAGKTQTPDRPAKGALCPVCTCIAASVAALLPPSAAYGFAPALVSAPQSPLPQVAAPTPRDPGLAARPRAPPAVV